MNKSFIIVKWDLEGVHYWPDAPNEYVVLRERHGHIFHFEVQIPVSTSRQLEFLEVRRALMDATTYHYGGEPCDFRDSSCEDLASAILDFVEDIYGCDAVARVFEDLFVGAEVRGCKEDLK